VVCDGVEADSDEFDPIIRVCCRVNVLHRAAEIQGICPKWWRWNTVLPLHVVGRVENEDI